MSSISRSIEIDVPVDTAYVQWTQFEQFPKFMNGVVQVQQLDDKRLRWSADVGGRIEHWEAEITEQIPDWKIAWRSTTGAKNAGTVTFDKVGERKTRVHLQMEYEPAGVIEKMGDVLGVLAARIDEDLKRFKSFIEARGVETGAWRGEIHPEDASPN